MSNVKERIFGAVTIMSAEESLEFNSGNIFA